MEKLNQLHSLLTEIEFLCKKELLYGVYVDLYLLRGYLFQLRGNTTKALNFWHMAEIFAKDRHDVRLAEKAHSLLLSFQDQFSQSERSIPLQTLRQSYLQQSISFIDFIRDFYLQLFS